MRNSLGSDRQHLQQIAQRVMLDFARVEGSPHAAGGGRPGRSIRSRAVNLVLLRLGAVPAPAVHRVLRRTVMERGGGG